MNSLITLTMIEINRYETINKLINKRISEKEARKILNLKSARQVRRIKKRVLKYGVNGVIHCSRGRPSNRRLNENFVKEILKIVKEKYYDFKPTFATEKLLENHNIKIKNQQSSAQFNIVIAK